MFGHQDNQITPPADTFNPALPPSEPAIDGMLASEPSGPLAMNDVMPTQVATSSPSDDSTATDSSPMSTRAPVPSDLLDLKQQALKQLSPLLGHLDQTPEEKFRTTMMMIQASDDQSLVNNAYEAAQAIPDEKARAQALLDIVNEINYFTQHPEA